MVRTPAIASVQLWTLLSLVPALGCSETTVAVLRAEEIGVLPQNSAIVGRDGGLSARCWDRSIWVYGDTVLNFPDEHGEQWHHNSYSVTRDFVASDGIDGFEEPLDAAGAPDYLIAPTPEEAAFNAAHFGDPCAEEPCGARYGVWPGAPVWDAKRQRALIFYSLIYAEPGEFNFEGLGSSIAVWTSLDARPERPVINPTNDHPDILFGTDEPGWGSGAQIVDDTLYVFGCVQSGLAHHCKLARVALDDLHNREAWEFRSKDAWVSDFAKAHTLFDGAPIMETSYNEYLGQWLLIYSHPFDHWAVARTAPELWGPWSGENKLYKAPETDAPYDVVHHPEFEEAAGKVQYLTYSRRTTGWFGAEFPVVRVEFE